MYLEISHMLTFPVFCNRSHTSKPISAIIFWQTAGVNCQCQADTVIHIDTVLCSRYVCTWTKWRSSQWERDGSGGCTNCFNGLKLRLEALVSIVCTICRLRKHFLPIFPNALVNSEQENKFVIAGRRFRN